MIHPVDHIRQEALDVHHETPILLCPSGSGITDRLASVNGTPRKHIVNPSAPDTADHRHQILIEEDDGSPRGFYCRSSQQSGRKRQAVPAG
jgi:hypothetical protein